MSAGYIGKHPTNNIFRKPGIWHSKEQFYHKKNENWDPEYTPGIARNAFYRDFANTEEGRVSGYTDSLPLGGTSGGINIRTPETSMYGVFIGDSGSKIYICGVNEDVVIQYELDTPYSIASLNPTKTKVRSLKDTSFDPTDIQFKPDGTKMYILDNQIDCVIEYAVDDAWNVTTAKPNSNAFNFNAQENNVTSVGFKTDGTKMYLLGAQNDAILQYSLSTAWDVSTASYDSVSKSVNDEADPRGMDFSDDGTKFYIVGTQDDLLRQYDMSTAWDITTASYTSGKDKSVGFLESAPRGFTFRKDDMSQFWLVGDGDRIHEWNSPSGIASYSSYSGVSHRHGTGYASPFSIVFEYEGDGTRFWSCDAQSSEVYEFRCAEPWNTDTAGRTGKLLTLSTYDTSIRDVGFKTDGTKLYFTGQQHDRVQQFDLSIPWDISSIIVGTLSSTPFTIETGIEGLEWNPDGSQFYVVGTQNDYVYQYDCTSAWDVGTAQTNGTLAYNSILGSSADPRDLVFNEDGSRLYVADTQSDYVNEFILTTPWDIDGGYTIGGRFYAHDNGSHQLAFGKNYTRMYVLGDQSDRIRQFDFVSNKVLTNKRNRA